MHRFRNSSLPVRVAVAGIAFACLIAACGGDDDDSSSSTTAPANDVCQQADALRSSVDDLKNVDLVAEGTNGATAAITDVKADLTALGDSVSDELAPDVQAVGDAIDQLESAVQNLDSGGAAAALDAVADVASTTSTLITSIDDGACSSSTTT